MTQALLTIERPLAQNGGFWHTLYVAILDTEVPERTVESMEWSCAFPFGGTLSEQRGAVRAAFATWYLEQYGAVLSQSDIALVGLGAEE